MALRVLRPWIAVLLLVHIPAVRAAEPALAGETQKSASPAPAGHKAEKVQNPAEVYELQKLLADTIDQVERNYVRDVSRRQIVEAAIKGVLRELDPYSAYISPEELKQFQSTVESEFGGIGIQISLEGGDLTVLSPLVDTPAYRAGVLAGDHILEIDGKNTSGLDVEEAVNKLKGEEGSKVTLKIAHPGKPEDQAVTVSLVRERIHVDTVLGDRRKTNDRWDFMIDKDRRIGYVRVSAFSRDTPRELEKALEELKKDNLKGLVLDLRFNPGGLLPAAIEVCDLFISKGRIVSTKGRNTEERVWEAHEEGTFEGFPMAILVNRFSASASEIVSACLQDHHRAVIVGERTWGKGSVQNVIPLEGNHSALKLTTAGYLRPNGKNIHRFPDSKEQDQWGVTPDKGYEMKLPDAELLAIMEDRRRRDVLAPKSAPAAAPGTEGTKAPEQPKPAEAAASPATTSVDAQLRMALDYLSGELAKAH
jgi:carboxyl-terminal processing protease